MTSALIISGTVLIITLTWCAFYLGLKIGGLEECLRRVNASCARAAREDAVRRRG